MTLQQRLSELVWQWHGLDATERTHKQEQLVSQLISLMKQELLPASPQADAVKGTAKAA